MPRRSHGLYPLRRTLTKLTTRRLDGRSTIAVAVRHFKEELAADLGGDLSRAQQTILEDAAQTWIIRQAIDDYISRQESLVTKKRAVLPVVRERMQIAEHLAKQLDRLGLERKAKPIESLEDYLRRRAEEKAATAPQAPAHQHAPGVKRDTIFCPACQHDDALPTPSE
jgi:hypothetical protein